MGLWRGFAAKKRAQRRSKIAAHELISVAIGYFSIFSIFSAFFLKLFA
jgi:hypothetical protein